MIAYESPMVFTMGLFVILKYQNAALFCRDARQKERFPMKSSNSNRIRFIVKVAILSAISYVVMQLSIPVWFAPNFYKLDLSEVIALLGGFALGPVAGIVIEFIKNALNAIGTTTMYVGELAAFCMGCAYVVPASIIYKMHKTRTTALIGMGVGTVTMAAVASVLNYFVMIPLYSTLFHLPLEAILAMGADKNSLIGSLWGLIIFAVVPFNLLKGVICSLVTGVLYKRLSVILKK